MAWMLQPHNYTQILRPNLYSVAYRRTGTYKGLGRPRMGFGGRGLGQGDQELALAQALPNASLLQTDPQATMASLTGGLDMSAPAPLLATAPTLTNPATWPSSYWLMGAAGILLFALVLKRR